MRTPVASLRTKSSYHFDNLILIDLGYVSSLHVVKMSTWYEL